ncbi:putative defensin-like protein 29 [Arabidopsis thaliana]|uniref:Putative defensin-like protein 29 n=4 Tax=Arabidopsis TaxID=3701 RepID=DEF29_ARATH|nr:Gamma-thionin family protein [Arabidopsis thaliana]Q2V3R9.1 RecName: Full=Putative defensin-like protein 29; Flags: Precursor [Arabidopsis thaliana]KAG7626839.1 Knottin scorpion toxin-like superfamily [Arabidopsis thaliana x Arabidopsis arenosa]KAG7632828.1 Knottin scorpion toxin-like superfamily [Arabidopsis suecica]AEE77370.1 Gamma-thionin family protein [Arabidopsis thaliana]VYS58844.1 unnamed protein product [Arabidopsis thaliana]|eukprot:NP_001030786.1 Gamma-thionin family protein [Arabidopsis thaliana]
MASSGKCVFLVFLCMVALLAPSEVHAKSMVEVNAAHKWYIVEGLCSKFPDCNKHCKEQKFPGGTCLKLGVNMMCTCIYS